VVCLAETKSQQGRKFDKICRLYTSICKERRKNRKSNDEEGGDKQKKQDSYENEKEDSFWFVCLIVIFTMLY